MTQNGTQPVASVADEFSGVGTILPDNFCFFLRATKHAEKLKSSHRFFTEIFEPTVFGDQSGQR